ncbi:helix-turn-helix transcriptional regulator [Sphingomonas sp.]|uniref:S24 family peptidase n=1 Tax=Sphingomonas sp. TaxID=28214 RepID=UPI0035B47F60
MQDDPRQVLNKLAEAAGVSLAALSRMLGRNAAYLQQFVGRGSPRRLHEEDRRRLAAFFGVAEERLGGAASTGVPRVTVVRRDVTVSAGPGAVVEDDLALGIATIDGRLARQLGLRDGAASMVRAKGDSMAPGLRDGDYLLVNEDDRSPGPRGGVYVLRIGEAVVVKRVRAEAGALVVTSDNPAAPPVPDGQATVIGRVVWQMRAPS